VTSRLATVPEQLLTILQICLLLLLYLFLARVLRAVWVEIGVAPARRSRSLTGSKAAGATPNQAPATSTVPSPVRLVFMEPAIRHAESVNLVTVTTVGRAPGSTVAIDDQFLSQNHARIRLSDGAWWIEDLGSTNGTSVNGVRLTGPSRVSVGDRIQLGDTVLEVQ